MSIFLRVDSLVEDYPNINPYTYVGNNPINFVDPDGRKIVGVSPKDAQNFKADIHSVLSNKKFNNVRSLIDVNGTTFKSIDNKAMSKALKGVSLSVDEQTYIDMVTNAINSITKIV
ncbi:MAG: hypothetical protein LBE34_10280 [Flavobacteriaceae bacterium]|jgi:Tol biopolymer transport system component|nr:hypothetical protein [Flavobacteriaceae bacterium]